MSDDDDMFNLAWDLGLVGIDILTGFVVCWFLYLWASEPGRDATGTIGPGIAVGWLVTECVRHHVRALRSTR
jgi:hypothetical protein